MKSLPTVLSVGRMLAAPALAYMILEGRSGGALIVFGSLVATDMLDGIVARALDATTARGAYLDVSADFAVMVAGFGSLAVLGVYAWWLLALFALMFGQFLLTSGREGPPRYDPIGKHYGVVLYGALGLTLALPDLALTQAMAGLLLVLTTITVGSRVAYLLGLEA